jgi:zinc transport system substrate-binding protein
MKRFLLLLAVAFLCGCSDQQKRTGKPLVFVSIPPQAGLLRALVGDEVEVRTLVGEGQSPHSYEPTARQLAALGEAEMLFTIGVPFEKALLNKIRPLYPDLPIIGTDENIEKRAMPHVHHGEHCTHDHGEPDPHIWLNARNAAKIAESMFNELGGGSADRTAFDQLLNRLKMLEEESILRLAPFKGSRFYVFHPSFGYFADAYGLKQIAIELDGKSPSPRQLADLIEQAKADSVKVIFVQKQFPVDSANAVAEAIDGTVVQLDPLAEDVVANLKQITDSIAQALEQ